MPTRFDDRVDAGRRLAEALKHYAGQDVVVVGLPRGGVPVGYEVARALDVPLDVYVVRKLGAPGHPELGMGAVGPGGARVLNEDVVRSVGATRADVERATRQKSAEVEERLRRFRGDLPPLDVRGRVVIVVDDGVATGGTARVALRTLRQQGPRRLVLAVPVGARESLEVLRGEVDELVALEAPPHFMAVGYWYRDFRATTDEEVARILQLAHRQHPLDAPRSSGDVRVPVDGATLDGTLAVPGGALGTVVLVHGTGAGRGSPRGEHLGQVLRREGFATLLLDLLTAQEQGRPPQENLSLMADRLLTVCRWLGRHDTTRGLPVGLLGISTGAAVALLAAARSPRRVQAIVCLGGRPDLAGDAPRDVESPTRFVVGGLDVVAESVGREAMDDMSCETDLVLVPAAGHLFEESGTLDEAARSAAQWFHEHLVEHVEAEVRP